MTGIPYIDPSITKDLVLEPLEARSTSFPMSEIPDVLLSVFFIVEKCGEKYFVRHIYNPYFCLPTREIRLTLELMRPVSDEIDAEHRVVSVNIDCLVANFSGVDRTLAYATDSERQSFLKVFGSRDKFEELPVELQSLYQAANMNSTGYLKFNDSEVRTPSMARVMGIALGNKFW